MSFQTPSALWLLLGVPILIVIWLIRPQHENRRVSSSYIWRLSDRFMKRRLPLSNLTRWLVFLLQFLLVSGCAILAAGLIMGHGGKVDYLVILDSSASMRTKNEDGETRFDRAVKLIKDLAKETSDGHSLSVITAGEKAGYTVSGSSSRTEINDALGGLVCGWGGSALPEAMTLAQLFVYEHPSAEVILYTDQTVNEYDGLSVVDLSAEEWNAALTDLSVSSSGAGFEISARLTSWGRDERISVGLTVNDKLIYAENHDCLSGTAENISFTIGDISGISKIEISIDPGDALDADNRLVYYNDTEQTCDTALISDTPIYLSSAFSAVNRGEVSVIPSNAAPIALQTGIFDLYVFDGCAPESFPVLGTIVLINLPSLPEGLSSAGESDQPGQLMASAAGSGYQTKLLSDLTLDRVSIAKHQRVNASDDWTTVCSVSEDPVLLVRSNGIGQTTVVLLFDLHDSNLPMKADFVGFVRNLLNLAVPPLADKKIVTVGDKLTVTVPQTANHLSVISPEGETTVFDYESEAEYKALSAGPHRLICDDYETGFFAVIPESEGHRQTTESLSISHETAETGAEPVEAVSGLWKIIAAVLLLILLAEWGIYLYEQY